VAGGHQGYATGRLGECARDRPVHVSEIVATLDDNLGIDVTKPTLIDPIGRPQCLVETSPIAELQRFTYALHTARPEPCSH
jgi:hypothetical protein